MPGQQQGIADEALRDLVDGGFPAAVAALGSLVRIPSVGFPGFPDETLRESAEAVRDAFAALNVFDTVMVARAATPDGGQGSPAVVARRAARNGRPTVLLYAHHDVQPPGPDSAWTSPPFVPTVRGERLYGRGASDDKGGVVTHLAAVRAVAEALGDDLDLGIALFVEGEEEAGSRSFDAFLADHHDLLAADVIVVADSDNPSVATPALTTSLRGNVTFALTVATLGHPSHSGMYGGAVPDAMLATVRLLDTLWTDTGDVAVEGLRRTAPPREMDEASEAALVRDADLLPGVTPIGTGSVADRLWYAPAVTVTGIDAPDVENASNTLLSSIRVRVSVRVAPGQTAAEAYAAVRAHLERHAPFGAQLAFDAVDLGDPYLADVHGWAAEAASAALADGFGVPTAYTGIGGSIPFVAILVRTFPDAQILLTGVEDPDTRAHAPDESQHLGLLKHAITAEALLLARLNERTGA